MITAKNGHMCLNCGYAESAAPHKTPLLPGDTATPKVSPEPAVTKAAVVKPEQPAKEVVPASIIADEVKSETEEQPEPKPEPEASDDIKANSLEKQVKADIAEAIAAVEQPAETTKSDEPESAVHAGDDRTDVEPDAAAPVVTASEIIKTSGMSKTEDKPVDSVSPRGRTKGTLDLKPSREDLVKGAASVSAVDAIGPALAAPDKAVEAEEPDEVAPPVEVEPVSPVEAVPTATAPVVAVETEPVKNDDDVTPVHVIDHAAEAAEVAPEPTPEPIPVPVEPAPVAKEVPPIIETPVATPPLVATPAVTSNIPTIPILKEPLIAKTHPEPSSAKTVMMIVGALVIVTCATVAAYFFTSSKNSTKVGQNATASQEKSAAGSGESAAVLDKSATPTPSPSPKTVATSEASTAQARDLKRKADLAAYAASVKAAATNGYYPTAAPGISATAVDPTTGKSYAVATTPAATLGSIQYLAGGKCTAPNVTPGKTSTHYIALSTKLETDSAPYCLDVQ